MRARFFQLTKLPTSKPIPLKGIHEYFMYRVDVTTMCAGLCIHNGMFDKKHSVHGVTRQKDTCYLLVLCQQQSLVYSMLFLSYFIK